MIKQLLSEMTLKEKVGQLNQRLYGWNVYKKTSTGIVLTEEFKKEVKRWGSLGFIYGVFRSDPWSGKNLTTGLHKEEAFEVSKMIQKYLKEHTRLKIPVFLSEECPHGHQALDSLTAAANYSSGASWNPLLYQEIQKIVANEIREKGAHLGLISTLDIARDPRWGRTEECFSEDPFLASQFTIAALLGLQGEKKDKISKNHVLAVLKHFAAQGSAMGGHNSGPVNIGQRELKEIHLLPMKYGIKNGAELCMAAYNDIDGIPCHGNAHLLNELLRNEMGFKGAVMADGCALDRLVSVAGNEIEAASWSIESGIDISLWDNVFPYLEEAVEVGRLDESIIDQSVFRVLKLKEKMGLFEEPTPLVKGYSQKEKEKLSIQLAAESLVLIKNQSKCLPINSKTIKKVSIVGPNTNAFYNQLGDYTPFKSEEKCVSLLTGIKNRLKNEKVIVEYEQGCMINMELEDGIQRAIEQSEDADYIVLALGGSSARDFTTIFDANGAALSGSNGMTSGENVDLSDISIPSSQVKLVKKLHHLGKKMIGVFIQGRPHAIEEIEPYLDSILIAGYPGEHGGTAMASILFGDYSPSGKLAMSIPKSSGQLPVYYNYRDIAFKKDYFDQSGKAHYPFGFGLTYTKFKVTNTMVSHNSILIRELKEGERVSIKGKITNEGDFSAAEVIQVYLKSHQTKVITRIKELKGFTKVWLEPGETKVFEIDLCADELIEYDENISEKYIENSTLFVETTNYQYETTLKIVK